MPASALPIACLLAVALLSACRPGDAPQEPTEPTEPTVSRTDDAVGGVNTTLVLRSRALARPCATARSGS